MSSNTDWNNLIIAGNENWDNHFQITLAPPSKSEDTYNQWFSSSLTRANHTARDTYKGILSSIVHNRPTLETTQKPITSAMSK